VNQSATDKRIYVRIPVHVHTTVKDEDFDGTMTFVSEDLSIGGVFLRSDYVFDIGTGLDIELNLPDECGIVRATAKVVWARIEDGAGSPGMGISFVDFSDVDRRLLEQFVAAQAGSA